MTFNAGLEAYWIDHLCIAQEDGPEKMDDIHRICDAIRGARQISVAVPNLAPRTPLEWGSRMWTLSEALPSRNNIIRFCAVDGTSVERQSLAC
jgi:hypothetical protein